ncbi:hypothetical protein C499_18909 [Halogeometricum borinquense DSM 11551]|uniref:Uncharacterized protein n=2 Tax=Halogeometricum borinquense TaxID=60847 RepID=E4NNC9_HALBP|nr:hypothetical protein [Halogeometricum borinquense]ADQ67467.1 hypothetical protein Hbor_19000 [Halogeometricum borinquense DSM 11551]ELY23851.1 hypothetical protein C499_18909 [Halogeometricum borinquense DSM 11551]RYJ13559.1 hypothetical protein ELS19_06020 [Halogeometricum borinquense]
MNPRVGYQLSFFVFGTVGLLHGVTEYVYEGQTVGLLTIFGGGFVIALTGYNTVRPESYDSPEKWGTLVYLTVIGSLLFAMSVSVKSV